MKDFVCPITRSTDQVVFTLQTCMRSCWIKAEQQQQQQQKNPWVVDFHQFTLTLSTLFQALTEDEAKVQCCRSGGPWWCLCSRSVCGVEQSSFVHNLVLDAILDYPLLHANLGIVHPAVKPEESDTGHRLLLEIKVEQKRSVSQGEDLPGPERGEHEACESDVKRPLHPTCTQQHRLLLRTQTRFCLLFQRYRFKNLVFFTVFIGWCVSDNKVKPAFNFMRKNLQ